MVHWISGDTAINASDAPVTGTTGFAQDDIFVLGVADLADGGVTILVEPADFAGGQANRGVTFVAGHERRRAARGADHLSAAAGNDFDIVNGEANRDGF